MILRAGVLPRWLGLSGLTVSALYLLNQGDILATAVPGFLTWDLAGLVGSTGWGLWTAALGVTLLLRPILKPMRSDVSPPDGPLASPLATADPQIEPKAQANTQGSSSSARAAHIW